MSPSGATTCPVCQGKVDVRILSKGVMRLTCSSCGWSEVVDNRNRKLLTEIVPPSSVQS
jgi:hypothetical protein